MTFFKESVDCHYMKLIVNQFKDHFQVTVRGANGINLFVFTYKTREEAKAFVNGFTTCRLLANVAIQDLPQDYTSDELHISL